jgi:hypothetical protein
VPGVIAFLLVVAVLFSLAIVATMIRHDLKARRDSAEATGSADPIPSWIKWACGIVIAVGLVMVLYGSSGRSHGQPTEADLVGDAIWEATLLVGGCLLVAIGILGAILGAILGQLKGQTDAEEPPAIPDEPLIPPRPRANPIYPEMPEG